MDTSDLTYLVAVGRAGALSAAAKRLGVSTSTVARRLDALEAALRLRLVDRGATGARLTPHGQQIAAMAEPLVDQASEIARAAIALGAGERVRPVRVSATEFVISDVLAPALPRLWARGAGFPVHLQSQAEVVSLAVWHADLAIRMSPPEGNSLLARKLPALRLGLFAAVAYLGRRDPSRVDLAAERLLVYDDSYGRLPELDWLNRMGLTGAVGMRTGSTRALFTAARHGAGVALLPALFAAADPLLVELPVRFAIPPRTPWLVARRDVRRLPGVSATHAWIVETFAALGVRRAAD